LKKITVGIIAVIKERANELQAEITQTGIATVTVDVLDFCTSTTDWSTRKLVDADPEIIVIDIGESTAALQTLQVVHTAIPNARLLVTSSVADPQGIIELMRAGVREFLPSPLTQEALLQAFNRYIAEKVRAHKHTQTRAKRGRLYCILSAKHGSGATTVAVNLAGIIASRSNQRTALIDLDRPLGDAAAYLNVKPNFTVTDAMAAGPRLDSVLLESYMQSTSGFQLLPGFREHNVDASLAADKLSHLLEVAQTTFDHTIVDLPTNLAEDQVKVITRHSSTTLVVLTPELPAIWRTERLLAYLTGLHAADKVRIVLNRSTRSDEINDADIERLLKMPLYCKLPNEYGACIKAINSGTLLDSSSNKYLSKALTSLAADLAGFPGIEARRGLFGMLLRPSMGGTNA
jgi:pilus assembly protein CpaE